MNEELETQLAKVLEKALSAAEQTGDFVIEQAPLLLQEFYRWHTFSAILGIILAIIIYLAGRYIPYIWLKKESQGRYSVRFFKKWGSCDNISKDPSASWIIYGITTVTSLVIFAVNIYSLTYILVAPKLYLIDYFI